MFDQSLRLRAWTCLWNLEGASSHFYVKKGRKVPIWGTEEPRLGRRTRGLTPRSIKPTFALGQFTEAPRSFLFHPDSRSIHRWIYSGWIYR